MADIKQLLSIVIPVYNESAHLAALHAGITAVRNQLTDYQFEVIYVNDRSTDDSLEQLRKLADQDKSVRIISLSRNFGKEVASTAGIHKARGAAVITLDGDGQHPPELLPLFVERWEAGAKVVIGVRTANYGEGIVKRYGSKLFYRLFNRITGIHMVPYSTDYRLIDRVVCTEFSRMTEHNRMTRALINWLGYQRSYIQFEAKARDSGQTGYPFGRLLKLAVDSVISLSISPLYIAAYLGAFVLPVSVLLGLFMVVDKIVGDPFHLNITGGGYVMVAMLFLIGVLLMSQGIIGLYLSHIHSETQNRPLYVIDTELSERVA